MSKPQLIILVGLPASGKSTFCSRFLEHNNNTVIINQDLLKTKSKCMKLLDSSLLRNDLEYIIVDRCHLSVTDRELYKDVDKDKDKGKDKDMDKDKGKDKDINKYCIYFEVTPDICKQRIVTRTDHPTIKPTSGVRIINMVKNKLVKPNKEQEQWFTKIITINGDYQISKILEELIS